MMFRSHELFIHPSLENESQGGREHHDPEQDPEHHQWGDAHLPEKKASPIFRRFSHRRYPDT